MSTIQKFKLRGTTYDLAKTAGSYVVDATWLELKGYKASV